MTLEYSSPRFYWWIGDLTWRSLLGRLPLAWSIACQPSYSWCCCSMPKPSPASSSTSNVDEELVRSLCLFSVMAPLFTFSRIRGKRIWFLVQHNLTSSDFLEWKKRLNDEEANIFIKLLGWSSLKREHDLFFHDRGQATTTYDMKRVGVWSFDFRLRKSKSNLEL